MALEQNLATGEIVKLDDESATLLEDLIASYHDALLLGDSTESVECRVRSLDPDSQAEFARAKQALEILALAARDRIDSADAGHLTNPEPLSWAEFGSLANDVEEGLQLQRLGRFTIERELGRGGLGVVFLAYDPLLDRRVALKVPRPEALLTPGVRARFDREGRAAARLTHPNLVPVHEVGRAGPISYIVTAYCAGPNLAAWLHERGELPSAELAPREAASLVAQLAEAVHYAHGQGVLHRDIKPSNVLLVAPTADQSDGLPAERRRLADWVPKLVDFGLARVEGRSGAETRSGTALGTLGYMSPEQATGRTAEIGPTTDVYGLGTILYELLTGRGPFAGLSEAECLRHMIEVDPPRPRKFHATIPLDLEAICLKCLEKKPADRYATAEELAADLERFLAGEPTRARSLSRLARGARWAYRNPWLAGLGSAAAMLLLLVAAVSSFAAWRIAEERDAAQKSEQAALVSAGEAQRQSQLAQQEAERAKREAATSERLSTLLTSVFQSADSTGLGGLGLRDSTDLGRAMTSQDLLRKAAELVLSEEFAGEEPLVRARLLARLARTCRMSGLFDESNQLATNAFQILQASPHTARDADWALVKQARGLCLSEERQYEAAEALLREAFDHATRAWQDKQCDEIEVAEVKFDLGWVTAEGRISSRDGERLLREVLDTRRRLLGDADPRTAMAATAVSIALLAHGNDQEVQKFLLDVLAPIYSAQPEGEAFTQATQSLLLGYVARQAYDLDRAIRHYRDAIAVVEALGNSGQGSIGLSADHPAMMLIWGELAGTYKQNGQYREAEDAMLKVIEISDRVLPNGHLRLINPLMEYSLELHKRRDFAAQENILQRVFSIYQLYPATMPIVAIEHWVRLKLHQGNQDAFLAAVDECLARVNTVHGRDRIATPECLTRMIAATEHPPEGINVSVALQRITEAADELLVDSSGAHGSVHRTLAMRWHELGNVEQAHRSLQRSLEIEVPSEGELSNYSVGVLLDVAAKEVTIGTTDRTEQHCQRLLNWRTDDHVVRSETFIILANFAVARQDLSAAIEYYDSAATEYILQPIDRPFFLVDCYRNLAAAHLFAGNDQQCLASLEQSWRAIEAMPRPARLGLWLIGEAVETLSWAKLLARRSPEQQASVERLIASMDKSLQMSEVELETGSINDGFAGSARFLRSSIDTTRSQFAQCLTADDRQWLDQAAAEAFLPMLIDACEYCDAKHKPFPNWQVRNDLELEVARQLMVLERFAEAEEYFLNAYESAQQALPARHQVVTGTAEEIAAFYTAWGREAEAEKYRKSMEAAFATP